MRCDLHVHTTHSGMCTVPVLRRICRESYSDPLEVYDTLKRRGMHLVTITDHDSIDAAESLRRYPDFFLSEELSGVMPSGTRFHMGVYDIEERDHTELQRRRTDFHALVAYLRERQLLFSINHAFSCLTGSRSDHDFVLFERYVPAMETRNGQMPASSNQSADEFARRLGKAEVGGSDAHTTFSLGSTYTEVRGARDRGEFLWGLRHARGIVHGESGRFSKLTRAVLEIACCSIRERLWRLSLMPLLLAVPLVTLINVGQERAFARYWARRLRCVAASPGWRAEAA